MGNQIYSFFALFFYGIAISLGFYILIDIIITSIIFLFSGNFDSFLQRSIFKAAMDGTLIAYPDVWRINTELQGLNFLVNWFIELQFSISGRWKMLGISSIISFILLIFGLFFNFDIKTNSSNPKRPTDTSIVCIFSGFVTLATLLPLINGILAGGLAIMMGL